MFAYVVEEARVKRGQKRSKPSIRFIELLCAVKINEGALTLSKMEASRKKIGEKREESAKKKRKKKTPYRSGVVPKESYFRGKREAELSNREPAKGELIRGEGEGTMRKKKKKTRMGPEVHQSYHFRVVTLLEVRHTVSGREGVGGEKKKFAKERNRGHRWTVQERKALRGGGWNSV